MATSVSGKEVVMLILMLLFLLALVAVISHAPGQQPHGPLI